MRKALFIVLLLAIFTVEVTWAAPAGQETEGEHYIVQADDWLSKIADKYYGDMWAYPTIVTATNAKAAQDETFAVIENPDLIEIGQSLWLPKSAAVTSLQAEELTVQESFTDPFAYCAAVGTVDVPDQRYSGQAVPEEIITSMRSEVGLSDDAPLDWIMGGTFWRCMEGQVWACFVGANIPCMAQADTSDTPTEGMLTYCQENPTADGLSAVVTGRETVYTWRCTEGKPEIISQIFEPDAQGFLADFWYKLDPPEDGG